MELWEFCAQAEGFEKLQSSKARAALATSWQTAKLSGLAFAGKLKDLKTYLPDENDKVAAPKISKEEYYAKLAARDGGEAYANTKA